MVDRELYVPNAGPTTVSAAGPLGCPRRSGFGPNVPAVKCTEPLGRDGPKGPGAHQHGTAGAAAPAEQWIAGSAGHGAKGRRLCDWIRVELAARPPLAWPGGKGGRGGLTGGLGLLPLTVPEVRRLLVALVWTTPSQAELGAGLVPLAPEVVPGFVELEVAVPA
jgi:hypothetical protein